MSDMIKLTGLWLNTKDGKQYFSGSLGGAKVLIFKNDYKKEDKHPDYNLFLVKKEKREDAADETPGDAEGF
jgi:hypothetical protein